MKWMLAALACSAFSMEGQEPTVEQKIEDAIRELSNGDVRTRDAASALLEKMGDVAAPRLEKALNAADLETRTRAAAVLAIWAGVRELKREKLSPHLEDFFLRGVSGKALREESHRGFGGIGEWEVREIPQKSFVNIRVFDVGVVFLTPTLPSPKHHHQYAVRRSHREPLDLHCLKDEVADRWLNGEALEPGITVKTEAEASTLIQAARLIVGSAPLRSVRECDLKVCRHVRPESLPNETLGWVVNLRSGSFNEELWSLGTDRQGTVTFIQRLPVSVAFEHTK